MAIRTTQDKVKGVLLSNYNRRADLTPFIRSFSKVIDKAIENATANDETIDSDTALEMETWGAAWAYCLSDPMYTSKSTMSASGSFTTKAGDGLKANPFGEMVLLLDDTGWVEAAISGNVASIMWGGKTESEALSWEDRN